jgi:hypothetical protein
MRSQEAAADDAQENIVSTINALQDADAPQSVISEAEGLYIHIKNL